MNMINRLLKYFIDCNHYVPTSVIAGLLIVFCLGATLFLLCYGFNKGIKRLARLLFFELLYWLFSITILYRPVQSVRKYHFTPFWSYHAIYAGNELLLTQNIMNVLAFIPVGLLMGCSFDRIKWWKVFIIGGVFSVIIETLQFVMKRGFAEFDDFFHNVLGCLIGFGLYVGIKWLVVMMGRVVDVR